jgi:hypothetical protein
MKRKGSTTQQSLSIKKRCVIQKPLTETKDYCFNSDILFIITEFIITNRIIHRKDELKIIIDDIKALVLTNKALYSCYNTRNFFNYAIDAITKVWHGSHESVMKSLPRTAQKHFLAQRSLKLVLLRVDNSNNFTESIDTLLKKGARLNFTYNHKGQPHTPLMMLRPSSDAFKVLLERGSSINETTTQGTTPLMLFTKYPIQKIQLETIIEHKDINIDQINSRGETALVYCVRNRRNHHASEIFITAIQKLLDYGANPCLKDKYGNTALSQAQKLPRDVAKKEHVIKILTDAIAKKAALSSGPSS